MRFGQKISKNSSINPADKNPADINLADINPADINHTGLADVCALTL